MDFSAANKILSYGGTSPITGANPILNNTGIAGNKGTVSENRNASFDSVFQSALDLVNETNDLTNIAEEETINFALGYTDNWHDLMTAQNKASMSLQYTISMRNAVLDAYKEIMNMQF